MAAGVAGAAVSSAALAGILFTAGDFLLGATAVAGVAMYATVFAALLSPSILRLKVDDEAAYEDKIRVIRNDSQASVKKAK